MTDTSLWQLDRAGDQQSRPPDDDNVMLVPAGEGEALRTWPLRDIRDGLEVRPGIIERAAGHELPAVHTVEWDAGTVPPVLILSPLSFGEPIQVGMVVGIEIDAIGGGGGQPPPLTIDLRDPDGGLISTQARFASTAISKPEFVELVITAPQGSPAVSATLNVEGVGGTDAGAIEIEIRDVLGFTGSSKAARLVAMIADRLIALEADMGITQAEAITLINSLIPAAQRPPSPAGHGGQLLAANDGGGAIIYRSVPSVLDEWESGLRDVVNALPQFNGFYQFGIAADAAETVAPGRGTLLARTGHIDSNALAVVEYHAHNPTADALTIRFGLLAVGGDTADAGWQTDAVDVAAGGTETGTIIAEGALAGQQLELRAWHSGAASAAEVVYGLLSTALLPDRP
ncbi:MAG: hypothetical protein OXT70_01295 [Chloroflexota bacterium]|nr:hypothetical protein [Chloroflexota bacterium]